MDEFKQYLMALMSAAIICALFNKLSFKTQSLKMLIRLISTVFLLITAFSPFIELGSFNWMEYPEYMREDANEIIAAVQVSVAEETEKYISDRIRAYIVDRAATYGATLDVQVNITDRETMIPDTVTIIGNISPYGKNALKNMIIMELGIPEENQIWK